jgi:SAM-dependent methyltransferase
MLARRWVDRGERVMGLVGANLGTARGVWRGFPNLGRFVRDVLSYGRQLRDPSFAVRIGSMWPILTNMGEEAGCAEGEYFLQDLWAARLIYVARPSRHVDVASRIDGFVAHLLTFMDVEVVDARPLRSSVEGLLFRQGDARTLESWADGSVESLSCLHAMEHFGLGRYGDEIDPDAWKKACRAFVRVLAPGGRLYLGVPIGRQRVEFNAQRVFDPMTVLAELRDLELAGFAAVDGSKVLTQGIRPDQFRCSEYTLGLFLLVNPGSRKTPK